MSEPTLRGRSGFLAAMQVKQYVGEVRSPRGLIWKVFTTGDAWYYLFDLQDPTGTYSMCQHVPVRKTELRREIRSALANGCRIDLSD